MAEEISTILTRLPRNRFAAAQAGNVLAQEQLRIKLDEYWSNPTRIAGTGLARPVDLVPLFRDYAQAALMAYGRQYIKEFEQIEDFETFLNRELIPAVIQEIIPSGMSPAGALAVGLNETLREFEARVPRGIDGYSPDDPVPNGRWEVLMEQTWFDRSRLGQQWSGFAGWIDHPFVWALRSPSNRELFLEELEVDLGQRIFALEAEWWAEAAVVPPTPKTKGTRSRSIRTPAKTPTAEVAMKWTDIEILFTDEDRVQIIKAGKRAETCNYEDMGFEDARSGKANQSWRFLKRLAESNGVISKPTGLETWTQVEKGMQEIRKVLREYFSLSGDPIPFRRKVGYKTLFKISLASSYNS